MTYVETIVGEDDFLYAFLFDVNNLYVLLGPVFVCSPVYTVWQVTFV